jgi:hypothetical protein
MRSRETVRWPCAATVAVAILVAPRAYAQDPTGATPPPGGDADEQVRAPSLETRVDAETRPRP